jgi:DNA-binding response OmpR family regulator
MTVRRNFPSVPMKEVPTFNLSTNRGSYRPVVMVVDDESSIADTLAEILSRSGYAAVTAYDGESALETALLMPPEMLITDVMLPGMSGIDLAITIRRIFPDCKIILFSGQASTADLLAAANRDGHQFTLLTKPVHPGDLLARIADGLKHRKAQPAATI